MVLLYKHIILISYGPLRKFLRPEGREIMGKSLHMQTYQLIQEMDKQGQIRGTGSK